MILDQIAVTCILRVQSVVKVFQCSFRIKHTQTSGSIEQRFLERVVKKSKALKNEPISEMLEKLNVIKGFGFNVSEVVDCPEILKLDVDELNRRYKLLSGDDEKDAIVLPMFKYATCKSMTSRIRERLRDCRKKMSFDGVSRSEKLKSTLECSEEEMLQLYIRNPRLGGPRKNQILLQKIEMLYGYGARSEDILKNSSMLENNTMSLIEQRAKLLYDLGLNNPLPIDYIGRKKEIFEGIIAKLMDSCDHKEEIQQSLDVLNRMPTKRKPVLYNQKKKLDYLVKEGYKPEEIAEHSIILCRSMDAIQKSVEELKKQHIESATLFDFLSTMSRSDGNAGERRYPHNRRVMRLLQGHVSPDTRKNLRKYFKAADSDLFKFCNKNLKFLLNQGFNIEDLSKLPIILCHKDGALQECWEEISSSSHFRQEFSADKVVILNRLQYLAENSQRLGIQDPSQTTEKSTLENGVHDEDYNESDYEETDYAERFQQRL